MKAKIKTETEKIKELLSKIRYRVYQAEICAASHDSRKMASVLRFVRVCCGKVQVGMRGIKK